MKKTVSIFLIIVMFSTLSFTGCNKQQEEETTKAPWSPAEPTTAHVPPDFVPIFQKNDKVVAYVGEEVITEQLLTAMTWILAGGKEDEKPSIKDALKEVIEMIVVSQFIKDNDIPLNDFGKTLYENSIMLADGTSQEDLSKMGLTREQYLDILKQTEYLTSVIPSFSGWMTDRIISGDGDIKIEDKSLQKEYEKCVQLQRKAEDKSNDENSAIILVSKSFRQGEKLKENFINYLIKQAKDDIKIVE